MANPLCYVWFPCIITEPSLPRRRHRAVPEPAQEPAHQVRHGPVVRQPQPSHTHADEHGRGRALHRPLVVPLSGRTPLSMGPMRPGFIAYKELPSFSSVVRPSRARFHANTHYHHTTPPRHKKSRPAQNPTTQGLHHSHHTLQHMLHCCIFCPAFSVFFPATNLCCSFFLSLSRWPTHPNKVTPTSQTKTVHCSLAGRHECICNARGCCACLKLSKKGERASPLMLPDPPHKSIVYFTLYGYWSVIPLVYCSSSGHRR